MNLCGRLDLAHLAALLALAPVTVSNSTGPLHLADALGRKVLGLYSRNFYSSPRRWGPYRQPANVMQPPGEPCAGVQRRGAGNTIAWPKSGPKLFWKVC